MSKPLRKQKQQETFDYIRANERYELLQKKIQLFNSIIQRSQSLYDRTLDEEAYLILQDALQLKGIEMDEFWKMDEYSRQEEMKEFWSHLGQWGDSVRDWFLHYHDKDMSS